MSVVMALPLSPAAVAQDKLSALGDQRPAQSPGSPPAPPAESKAAPADAPWRAHEALGLAWLRFGLEHRSRFEHLGNDFRASHHGAATGYFMRTLLSAELRFLPLVIGAELEDSRAWLNEASPVNVTLVNPLEPLQAYAGLRFQGLLAKGDTAALTAGRMTLDLGSRRLVARNEFRNTINAFTGLDLQWASKEHDQVRAFAVMPVVRLPSDADDLRSNAIELDRENTHALFWGVFAQTRALAHGILLEAYVLGLHEGDVHFAPSANRKLVTPGVRTFRAPAPRSFDYQLEMMGQFGSSRASTTNADTTDLKHRAWSLHASAGYRFDVAWAPRLVAQYDFASGDRSPGDHKNQRFDPLFGARRFEFGPTDLYGALSRSNLNSPGLRLELSPHEEIDAFAAYRLAWLASAQDSWTAAGVKDPSGNAGRFVGQQMEARLRWHIFPRNLSLELGGALLVPGRFPREAPDGQKQVSPYVYTQITGTI